MSAPGPLTLGTAGHVDHGKTALVAALTGVDTDRLPEERARGLTIVLGYARLTLPSGRSLSLVDVPGHERFVRTMVAGASGIDAFLMAIAADDGVMPQTLEHAAVLAALGVRDGVVAVTKADLADPARAVEEARELLPGCEAVACSARTGAGIGELRAALDRVAAGLESRALAGGPARLHVDRVFTVAGRGTVVTGTLWSGALAAGDALELVQAGRGARAVRVRGLHVHDAPVERAAAGQRVAVNLLGVRTGEVARGDVLAAPRAVRETRMLDCALDVPAARHGERVQVHHGARDVAGRLALLSGDDGLWQVRLEAPLLARDGDRVVVRRLAPPDTLGGGVVLDAAARRHGRRPEIVERLRALARGESAPTAAHQVHVSGPYHPEPAPPAAPAAALAALEARLRAAGPALLSEAQMAGEEDALRALRALRADGRAVRISGRLYAHADVAAAVRADVVALLAREGSATLAQVRDALGLSRKTAQAFLEHLDAERVTRRLPDDRRELARRPAAPPRPPAAPHAEASA
ncbi:MAG TPA: selenocysteine-specific translation elongation factor [Conexibacter sp.]|nr:selenocysteine-specific translation elongation factor [Conexibacter sp.]